MSIKTYSELIKFDTFIERFRYLKLNGVVGRETFGFDRYINQLLYQSRKWRSRRDYVITRDLGCDLGVVGYEIYGRVLIHHMNPITVEDILHEKDVVFDPEFLITTVHNTHNAIHYGDERLLITEPVERKPNDTCPWLLK